MQDSTEEQRISFISEIDLPSTFVPSKNLLKKSKSFKNGTPSNHNTHKTDLNNNSYNKLTNNIFPTFTMNNNKRKSSAGSGGKDETIMLNSVLVDRFLNLDVNGDGEKESRKSDYLFDYNLNSTFTSYSKNSFYSANNTLGSQNYNPVKNSFVGHNNNKNSNNSNNNNSNNSNKNNSNNSNNNNNNNNTNNTVSSPSHLSKGSLPTPVPSPSHLSKTPLPTPIHSPKLNFPHNNTFTFNNPSPIAAGSSFRPNALTFQTSTSNSTKNDTFSTQVSSSEVPPLLQPPQAPRAQHNSFCLSSPRFQTSPLIRPNPPSPSLHLSSQQSLSPQQHSNHTPPTKTEKALISPQSMLVFQRNNQDFNGLSSPLDNKPLRKVTSIRRTPSFSANSKPFLFPTDGLSRSHRLNSLSNNNLPTTKHSISNDNNKDNDNNDNNDNNNDNDNNDNNDNNENNSNNNDDDKSIKKSKTKQSSSNDNLLKASSPRPFINPDTGHSQFSPSFIYHKRYRNIDVNCYDVRNVSKNRKKHKKGNCISSNKSVKSSDSTSTATTNGEPPHNDLSLPYLYLPKACDNKDTSDPSESSSALNEDQNSTDKLSNSQFTNDENENDGSSNGVLEGTRNADNSVEDVSSVNSSQNLLNTSLENADSGSASSLNSNNSALNKHSETPPVRNFNRFSRGSKLSIATTVPVCHLKKPPRPFKPALLPATPSTPSTASIFNPFKLFSKSPSNNEQSPENHDTPTGLFGNLGESLRRKKKSLKKSDLLKQESHEQNASQLRRKSSSIDNLSSSEAVELRSSLKKTDKTKSTNNLSEEVKNCKKKSFKDHLDKRHSISAVDFEKSSNNDEKDNCSLKPGISTASIANATSWFKRRNLSRQESKHGGSRRKSISCRDLGGVDCEGWLLKKKKTPGLKKSKWKRWWCVLEKKQLRFYTNEKEKSSERAIYLPGLKIAPVPELKTQKFAFKAFHSGCTFHLATESREDMIRWMNKMSLASLSDFEVPTTETIAGFNTAAGDEGSSTYNSDSDSLSDSSSESSSSKEGTDDNKSGESTASVNRFSEQYSQLHGKLASFTAQLKEKEALLDALEALLTRTPITSKVIHEHLHASQLLKDHFEVLLCSDVCKLKEITGKEDLVDDVKAEVTEEAVEIIEKEDSHVGQERTDVVGQERTDVVGQERTDVVGQERTDVVGKGRTDVVGKGSTDVDEKSSDAGEEVEGGIEEAAESGIAECTPSEDDGGVAKEEGVSEDGVVETVEGVN